MLNKNILLLVFAQKINIRILSCSIYASLYHLGFTRQTKTRQWYKETNAKDLNEKEISTILPGTRVRRNLCEKK